MRKTIFQGNVLIICQLFLLSANYLAMVCSSAKGLQLALVLLIRSTPHTSYRMLPLAITFTAREGVVVFHQILHAIN